MEKSELNFFEKMTLVGALDNLFDYLVSNDKDIDDFFTKEEQFFVAEEECFTKEEFFFAAPHAHAHSEEESARKGG